MAGEPIEEVFVEIGADTAPLDEGVKKSSEKSSKKLKSEFDKAVDSIDRAIGRLTKNVEKNLEIIATSGEVSAVEVEAALTHAARAIEDEFQQMAKSVERSFAKVDASAAGTAAFSEGAAGAAAGASELTAQTDALGKAFNSLIGAMAGIGPGMFVIAGAVAFLLPTVIALAAALAQLAGAIAILPAGIATLVTAVLPLVVAFKGFGDALSAIASGDAKKIDAALKKLAPSARAVAQEFAKLQPTLETFKKSVQEAFFRPLVGDLTRLAKVLLPALRGGFTAVAGAFGKLFDNFARYLGQKDVVKQINDLFKNTAAILGSFSGVGPKVFQGMLDAATALAPIVKDLATKFAGLAGTFGEWLSKVSKNGQLKKWFDDAKRVAGELWDLLKSIGSLIGTIFGHFTTDGEDVIKTLTDVVNKLDAFYKSAEGQKSLERARNAVTAFISALEYLVAAITFSAKVGAGFIDTIKSIYQWFKGFYTFMAGSLVAGIQKVGEFFAWLGGKIVDGLGAAWDFIKEWGAKIGNWFASLPGIIWGYIQKIPSLIVQVFKNSIDQALFVIGAGIGLIITAVTKLPGALMDVLTDMRVRLVKFFTDLWAWIVQAATNGWTWVVTTTRNVGNMIVSAVVNFWNSAVAFTRKSIQNIIDFVIALPGRIVAFTKSAAAAIANFFSNVFNGGKERAKSAIDAIIGFVKNLPSRLTGFVKNVGGDIANVIKDMLNYAIRKINDGIASVDKFVPGDLPRIPQLASGAVVKATPGGTTVTVGEGGEDEAVLPLSVLKKYFKPGDGSAGGGGVVVNFGPGSITVQYTGAQPPTEPEAQRIGAAIGHGIASTLEKRDVRTSVRRI